jgi:hypothetical protein
MLTLPGFAFALDRLLDAVELDVRLGRSDHDRKVGRVRAQHREIVVIERHHALQLVGDDGRRAPAERVPIGLRPVQLAVADGAPAAGLVHHGDRLPDHLRDALEDRAHQHVSVRTGFHSHDGRDRLDGILFCGVRGRQRDAASKAGDCGCDDRSLHELLLLF